MKEFREIKQVCRATGEEEMFRITPFGKFIRIRDAKHFSGQYLTKFYKDHEPSPEEIHPDARFCGRCYKWKMPFAFHGSASHGTHGACRSCVRYAANTYKLNTSIRECNQRGKLL